MLVVMLASCMCVLLKIVRVRQEAIQAYPGPTTIAVMIKSSNLMPFGSSAMADIGLDVIVSTSQHHHLQAQHQISADELE